MPSKGALYSTAYRGVCGNDCGYSPINRLPHNPKCGRRMCGGVPNCSRYGVAGGRENFEEENYEDVENFEINEQPLPDGVGNYDTQLNGGFEGFEEDEDFEGFEEGEDVEGFNPVTSACESGNAHRRSVNKSRAQAAQNIAAASRSANSHPAAGGCDKLTHEQNYMHVNVGRPLTLGVSQGGTANCHPYDRYGGNSAYVGPAQFGWSALTGQTWLHGGSLRADHHDVLANTGGFGMHHQYSKHGTHGGHAVHSRKCN